MNSLPRIALLLNTPFSYDREIMRGIRAYAKHKPWVFFLDSPAAGKIASLSNRHIVGIIAHVHNEATAEELEKLKLPVVNVSNLMKQTPFPRVGMEDQTVGRQAADHLLERGFRSFAFFGFPRLNFSNEREAGFAQRLREAGCDYQRRYETYDNISLENPESVVAAEESVGQWLRSLPTPVGLFAYNDRAAAGLAELCRITGRRVPEDLAMLGVDNDEVYCEMAFPPLSSVVVPAQRIGYEAAMLLDRMIDGQPAPASPILLQPMGVLMRQSTDTLAMEDREVATAVRFIRDHASSPISVEDVLAKLSISRRSLERRFKEILGRSPLEEIRRVHLEKARDLLAQTDLAMPTVAKRSGFLSPERLAVVFRQETGMTPTDFRLQFRLRESNE